jgi:protoheme IX farnesyltransferase
MSLLSTRTTIYHPYAASSEQATVRDFITLLKPGVLLLVVFTSYVGMMAAPGKLHPFLKFVALFSISLASGGAAVINMWYDRDVDSLMKRTKNRPIPGGRIAPDHALTFGVLLSLLAVLLMALACNLFSAAFLAFTIFFYSIIYTMVLKRITPHNIVIGGAAGAFPPMIGWSAVGAPLSLEPYLLFIIIFLWTPPHFWALALNRSEDYKKANIPMLPNVKGASKTRTQILLYSVFLFAASLLPWIFNYKGDKYALLASLLGTLFVGLAVKIFLVGHERDCKKLFLFSILYLFLLFIGILAL